MIQRCLLTNQDFTISPAEIAFCEQHGIPLPTVHPHERLKHLLSFYNSSFLYNATCALTKKPILSIVPPTKELTIYDIAVWMDDNAWDPLSYGREFDFSRPFFEQFADLYQQVPVPSRSVVLSTMENSDYTNGISNAKNCYLIFDSNMSEDCYFCYQMNNVKNIVDCIDINDCELCYGSKHLKNCYDVRFGENCIHCTNSTFLFNCRNVKHCFGCTNLSNKEYYFYNQPLTKEAYEAQIAQLDLGSYQGLENEKQKFAKWKQQAFLKDLVGQSNQNSTGNFLNQCKDCSNTFFTSKAEDCEYCIRANMGKNCFMYAIFGINVELIYNCITCGSNAYNLLWCLGCFVNVRDLEYCMHVGFGSNNCFGCIGLRKKEYCILNKQYSKEDYLDLLTKIKAHMRSTGEYGQFFPQSLAPNYYNKSEAIHFFPMTRAEALNQHFSWEDEAIEPFESTYALPDHIRDVKDDILTATLKCQSSGKKYKVIKQELDLYRRFRLPIPHIAPLERIRLNCQVLQIKKVTDQACSRCKAAIRTVNSTLDQKVYCESCYQEVTA